MCRDINFTMESNKPVSTSITIEDRFRGPPRSGNGGYVGGTFARLLGYSPDLPVEVTLRSPVPLDQPMTVQRTDENTCTVNHGEQLVAEVSTASLELEVPAPPSWETALAARPQSTSLQRREGAPVPGGRGFHPVCFCCGADHTDGLYVFAAPVDDHQAAAAWETSAAWADEAGNIPPAWLWSALDCPGQIAYAVRGTRTGLLGRITARIFMPAPAGENYIVTAWPVEVDGVKHFAGTAIFDTRGELVGHALSVWIGRRN